MRIGAGPEPIKTPLEEESNPVAKHSDIEASLPQSFPHPAAATRRDVLRSTLIPLQLAPASPLAGRSVRRPRCSDPFVAPCETISALSSHSPPIGIERSGLVVEAGVFLPVAE